VTRNLDLPDAPTPGPDARMSAPSALRNRDHILAVLQSVAPERGRALEIASGTGEHVIAFAAATPGLDWQPTDMDIERLASVAAWSARAGLANLRPPLRLDASLPGWAQDHGPRDLIVLVNLLHLIPDNAAGTVLDGIAAALAPGGIALIYGPFLRDGRATSDGDARFDASLRAQDPAIGYKDAAWVADRLTRAGLAVEIREMPANNLIILARRPAV